MAKLYLMSREGIGQRGRGREGMRFHQGQGRTEKHHHKASKPVTSHHALMGVWVLVIQLIEGGVRVCSTPHHILGTGQHLMQG